MVTLSSAANAETAATAVLWDQGYELRLIRMGEERATLLRAQNGHDEFVAESALEILGLVALYKARGENWQPTDEEVARCIELENGNAG